MHPTPLDPLYVEKLVNIANLSQYHVDSFEICGQCHSPYGGLDGLINYQEYPSAFANWDQDKVNENQQKLNDFQSVSVGQWRQRCMRFCLIPVSYAGKIILQGEKSVF